MYALVLHNMGDSARWREAVADHELAFVHYVVDVECIVHDAVMPVPEYIAEFPFDIIILNSTFLGAVTDATALARIRERFDFISRSSAFKVALPQDDYYCSENRDQLMTDWKIDVVYTVCPKHWDVLYPRYLASGGKLKLGFTGYVTPRMRALFKEIRPRDQRRFDVVYRATGKTGFPNALAMVKSRLGTRFVESFSDQSWVMDITTDDRRIITGRAWWQFLANSRMTLGSNSGSSTLIRNLDVVHRIRDYLRDNPVAEYEDVVAACITPSDRALEFTAISPRVIEAALVETTQLLVPGQYSGVIQRDEHYLPIREDCSNRDEIIALVNDWNHQSRLAANCKEAVLQTPKIQIEGFLEDVKAEVSARKSVRDVPYNAFRKVSAIYSRDVGVRTKLFYMRQRVLQVSPGWLVAAYGRLRGV